MIVEYGMEIAAPMEVVFALVDDEANMSRWMTGLVKMEYPDHARDHPVGARFRQVYRERGRLTQYDGEVLAYEKPHRLEVLLRGRQFSVRVQYRLTNPADATHLDYKAEFSCTHAFVHRMDGLFNWFSRRVLERQMRNLKHLAEQTEDGLRSTRRSRAPKRPWTNAPRAGRPDASSAR